VYLSALRSAGSAECAAGPNLPRATAAAPRGTQNRSESARIATSASSASGSFRRGRMQIAYSFRHEPPRQLSPIGQMFPHRPQFDESPMKLELFTQRPMHDSYPGAHEQKPPVQVSEIEQRWAQRPQFELSFINLIVSTQSPMHHSCPAEQEVGPLCGPDGGGGVGAEGGSKMWPQATRVSTTSKLASGASQEWDLPRCAFPALTSRVPASSSPSRSEPLARLDLPTPSP
jgi:hypothetical protein